jgi:inner membrane transporter RhtA
VDATVGIPFSAVMVGHAGTGALMAVVSMLCVQTGAAVAVTLIDASGPKARRGFAWHGRVCSCS